MIGSGTVLDPRRPEYAPLPDQIGAKTGLIGFTYQASEDGQHALIELVALRREALSKVLEDRSIRAFEKGAARAQDIEAAFQQFEKDFKLSQFEEVSIR